MVETTASPVNAKANENAWSNVAKKSGAVGSPAPTTSATPASGEFKVAKAKRGRK